MDAHAMLDFAPLAQMALLGVLLAMGPLAWVWLRHRHARPASGLRALTLLTLFLTFDLVLFGAFTRLTDSGLGCPDWPGCYGSASPVGAREAIHAAQSALPSGPVTQGKAWVEMLHRYLATGVGVLVTVLAVASWLQARRDRVGVSPWWATLTLAWVCLQGAFGAMTVTMKLYPAIVTAHLLGGIGLLVLLAAQNQGHVRAPLRLSRGLAAGTWAVFGLSVLQVALGGWVSTNYAVLACSDFPTCQGSWWPAMDFEHGFTVLRELGAGKDGGYLPFAALTAIHWSHRLGAALVFVAVACLVWRLRAEGGAHTRRWAWALTAVAVWQFASGLSNVVLGWPLLAALAHTGGAAALITLLTLMLARAHQARQRLQPGASPSRQPATAAL
jgi:heme a synthase